MTSLLVLVERDGASPRRVSGTNGGEYASSCPACGGTDRFRIWPEQGRFWCRGCGLRGDAVQYLRDVRGLTYPDACRLLGVEPKGKGRDRSASQPPSARGGRPAASWTPKVATIPPEKWREKAAALVSRAEQYLWSPAGAEALAWLRNERFLADETIKAARLGWVPKDVWRDRAAWGLDEQMNDRGRPKKVWIPAGLVIPLLQGEEVHRVRVRRTGELKENDSRYVVVSGGSSAPMLLETDKGAVTVLESELDAILLRQDAGDLTTPVALGSASNRPDAVITPILRGADEVLMALDADTGGAKESWAWWTSNFPKARRWPPVGGKDPGEMRAAGVDLRVWIRAAIERVAQADQSGHAEAVAVLPGPSKEAAHKPFYDSPLIPFAGGARVCEPCRWMYGFRCRHEDGPGTERPDGHGCERFEADE